MPSRPFLEMLRAAICSLLMFTLAISAITIIQNTHPSIATAQDKGKAKGGEAKDAGGGDAADTGTKEEGSVLAWMFDALGPGYSLIFLGMSFTFVALLVMNLITARRENVVPANLVESFEAHLNEKKYQEAYDLAKSDDSFLGQVLSAGLGKLSAGYAQAIEAMQEVGEEENMKLEHRLSYMALIGTISPMLGLFGTVHGMIASFRVIANSDSTPKAQDLAVGISTALFTTLVGLAIAIPAIAAYNILRNRVSRLVLEVGILSEGLMGRFQTVGKK
ncbi:MAG: MotA/TolQ/ExbB proton channel family protein [Planctomycetales bacterium]|nr:MotA/TolQ/ExbB proton channel family protein [Planctomycetales bacterium]NIM07846.1 MotA/TolQ/ExbB proton channel family protein [Planctomycetales bacterium]NIN07338.1 MotA/TolQ/ExbB proton channel family protein [Planctomycetales bacterium]NIN76441.1 MotA/TolQ/ExbB proton channel family protein [Planctomycetales bacterium]NIO33637.1 MotA/TolQ/ExbB proton channel family protein [Planctomycetales bacterium]